jgi:hypothetical protein
MDTPADYRRLLRAERVAPGAARPIAPEPDMRRPDDALQECVRPRGRAVGRLPPMPPMPAACRHPYRLAAVLGRCRCGGAVDRAISRGLRTARGRAGAAIWPGVSEVEQGRAIGRPPILRNFARPRPNPRIPAPHTPGQRDRRRKPLFDPVLSGG